ncbi:MAG: RDD family protein [Treponema sp.]|jgi:uncharacterized RDD family membrane protein YckC|nr:RDD family protein [Treponema sp.]
MDDTTLEALTPEGIAFVLHPAGFPIRVCAWVIDALLQGVLLIAILIAGAVLNRNPGGWFMLIGAFVIDWFYQVLWEVFGGGQSPGKRAVGIQVTSADGSPVSPGASFLRNLCRFADSFLLLFLIAFLCMNCSAGFRRLGDWVGGTLVVYRGRGRGAREASLAWLGRTAPIAPPRPLSLEERQALLMFARRYPLLGKERADEIAAPWIASLSAGEGAAGPRPGLCPSDQALGMARWCAAASPEGLA